MEEKMKCFQKSKLGHLKMDERSSEKKETNVECEENRPKEAFAGCR
jgi:hypothetical protein